MTFPDVVRLLKHWAKYPPLRDHVASFLGFEIPRDEPSSKVLTAEDFKQMHAMTGGRVQGL